MNHLLCDAIREMKAIRFHYDGGYRTVEPHCHGASDDGEELLRGYQTGGFSQSDQSQGWKLFKVDEPGADSCEKSSFTAPQVVSPFGTAQLQVLLGLMNVVTPLAGSIVCVAHVSETGPVVGSIRGWAVTV